MMAELQVLFLHKENNGEVNEWVRRERGEQAARPGAGNDPIAQGDSKLGSESHKRKYTCNLLEAQLEPEKNTT